MLPLLQLIRDTVFVAAATPASSGPGWAQLAVWSGGILQVIVLLWIKSISDARKAQDERLKVLERLVTEMATHMGINGNGMLQAMAGIREEILGLRHDVTVAMTQLSEQRTTQHVRHAGS